MWMRSALRYSIIVLPFFILAACAGEQVSSQSMEPKALFEKRCTKCHTLDRTNKIESVEYWTSTVQRMKNKMFSGISNEDASIITDYLIKTKTSSQPSAGGGNSAAPGK
jgi:hypothetical protein